jgi:glycosyltransferase involved in cell wall biosynthesis
MATGTPVVAFNSGGIADSMAGFPDQLVSPIDAGALAKAIERYDSWRRTDPGLGEQSREWAVAHMSGASSLHDIDELLSAVLARRT